MDWHLATGRSARLARAVAVLIAGAGILHGAMSHAQEVRTEQVRFPKESSGTVIKGTIKGYQSVDYVLGVNAGQTLIVELQTSNSSNYFNVTAPGAAEAMHIGSVAGNRFEGRAPVSGNYRVSVYLMRNAARRGETARYSLALSVPASPATAAPTGKFADGPSGGSAYRIAMRAPAGGRPDAGRSAAALSSGHPPVD